MDHPRQRVRDLWKPVARAAGLSLAILALSVACTTVAPDPGAPGQDGSRGHTEQDAPYWVGKPLSWSSLSEIEDWLHSDAALRNPHWRVQGELILAEGRLQLARADEAAGSTSERTLSARREAARDGFERVLADAQSSPEQRYRAHGGIQASGAAPRIATPPRTGLVTRAQWGAKHEVPARLNPVGGQWAKITVHHSAEVPGVSLNGAYADSVSALQKIQRYHIENQGWGDVGYHFLIDSSGRVFEGRRTRWQGAHAGGNNNVRNLGICILGDYRHHSPTPAAQQSLRRLLDQLRQENSISRSQVHWHSEMKNTECPGPHIENWLRDYKRGAVTAQRGDVGLIGASASTARVSRASSSLGGVR